MFLAQTTWKTLHGLFFSEIMTITAMQTLKYNTQRLQTDGNSGSFHLRTKNIKLDFNWRVLPSFNYTIDAKINHGQDELVKIIMLDTILMCGNSGFDWELDQSPRFRSYEHELAANDYFVWLEDELIASESYPYVIVAGHFPVWSIAEHGPTKCLVDKLRPLLHKYQVSAYMCGHDHNLQHIQDTAFNQTVDYLLSGASNFVDNSTAHIKSLPDSASLKFHWADSKFMANGGFGLTKINNQNMTFTFYETTGKELYQTVIYPRNVWTNILWQRQFFENYLHRIAIVNQNLLI